MYIAIKTKQKYYYRHQSLTLDFAIFIVKHIL